MKSSAKTSIQMETLGSGLSSRGSAPIRAERVKLGRGVGSGRRFERLAGQEVVGRHPALHR